MKQLRLQHQSQLLKLQQKNESDLELLEILQTGRCGAPNLHNLSKTMLTRKRFRKAGLGSPNQPSPQLGTEGSEEDLSAKSEGESRILLALADLMTESEKEATRRESMANELQKEICEAIKDFSKEKGQLTKKNLDFGSKYHAEMWAIYEELDAKRVAYEKAWQVFDVTQKKYDEAVKKPNSGLRALKNLVTGKDGQERIERLTGKVKTRKHALNARRNEYLLLLNSVNQFHERYHTEDLPLLLTKIDGQLFSKTQMFLKHLEDSGKKNVQVTNEVLQNIAVSTFKIDRTVDTEQFFKEFQQIFQQPAPIEMDQPEGDSTKEIVIDDVSKVTLGQYLGLLVQRDDVLSEAQKPLEKEIEGLTLLMQAYTDTPQFGQPFSPMEKQVEIQNQLDMIKCQRYNLYTQMLVPIAPPKEVVPEGTPATLQMIQKGKVIEAYTAIVDQELTVEVGDEVTILEMDKGGWTKVKLNKTEAIGLIPSTSVHTVTTRERGMSIRSTASPVLTNAPNMMIVKAIFEYTSTDETELSFKVGDQIECVDVVPGEDWWVGKNQRTGLTGAFPVNFTQDWERVAAMAAIKPTGSTTMTRNNSVKTTPTPDVKRQSSIAGSKHVTLMAVAAFKTQLEGIQTSKELKATCDGELTITAGEIISKIDKDTGSDAWWEGTSKNGTGQFPSSYVIELQDDVRALYDFLPTNPGEIGFHAGDIIQAEDWWDGMVNNQFGAFPASYVEKVQ
ncbi:hypothetical protein EDD86DRAFT_245817 [Gorgonomyces haynaldii]|nr:hypothetical protein EDD86DRAFT_245817 [Gorgonomyces haynaldii]